MENFAIFAPPRKRMGALLHLLNLISLHAAAIAVQALSCIC